MMTKEERAFYRDAPSRALAKDVVALLDALDEMEARAEVLQALQSAAVLRNHDAGHILIAEIGSVGPENVDDIARRAATLLARHTEEVAGLVREWACARSVNTALRARVEVLTGALEAVLSWEQQATRDGFTRWLGESQIKTLRDALATAPDLDTTDRGEVTK